MIGLLIVTHCDLGRELLSAAEFIVGSIEAADSLPITATTGSEEMRRAIGGKISSLDKGEGVLILTDMFGGTPSNLSLSFLQEERVEVLTGVNLPMLIAIVQHRKNLKLKELAEKAQEAGKNGISLAGKLLESA
ncbi:MAG: PTS sugar transporter subunit IIA [Deltaproteobacteria bacterium]|nr:PTS sugar transporter subunit IIA [Deltaproteobacteria bacterium]MBW2016383.1 PTS sugar transporter subunit IIA [Deltaproteobacteria bacterium]MBW2129717.1 PTS sugar transporter subunit IIA [Deltaproteobacteria bacterium]MBW2305199.1 PTS sugar transporter subunit IIA [Deltaproteobacteria bacterium]